MPIKIVTELGDGGVTKVALKFIHKYVLFLTLFLLFSQMGDVQSLQVLEHITKLQYLKCYSYILKVNVHMYLRAKYMRVVSLIKLGRGLFNSSWEIHFRNKNFKVLSSYHITK